MWLLFKIFTQPSTSVTKGNLYDINATQDCAILYKTDQTLTRFTIITIFTHRFTRTIWSRFYVLRHPPCLQNGNFHFLSGSQFKSRLCFNLSENILILIERLYSNHEREMKIRIKRDADFFFALHLSRNLFFQ